MVWNLVRLSQLVPEERYTCEARRQLDFLAADAVRFPAGYAMFLLAFLEYENPPPKVTVVLGNQADKARLPLRVSSDTVILLLENPTKAFPLQSGETTFYVCRNHTCLPPKNDL